MGLQDEINELYWKQGLSLRLVADKLGITYSQLKYKMQKLNIETRSKSEATSLAISSGRRVLSGENNGNWKGGKYQSRYSKYGITEEDYLSMYEMQEGECAICGVPFDGNDNIDHCHTTGKVRGLLCSPCNRGLGFFRDNVEALSKAIDYLKA